ncbi:hypothetical protein MSAN_00826000 [Mycena sanguinolenta]|uniref:Uncharacterized protein n=1 Tax=Mycena sanguinolenta TaxID=230812 RepID=A0A8H6Z1I4_9AGAR|nr:hypothetical protein MSAN_00826000 [Mycena sanguinolenta]
MGHGRTPAMVLKMLAAAYAYWPTQYIPYAVVSLIALLATHRIAQGCPTGHNARTRPARPRRPPHQCVHAAVPLGLMLLEALVQRGAEVIALTADKMEEERVATFVDLVRTGTENENILRSATCATCGRLSVLLRNLRRRRVR